MIKIIALRVPFCNLLTLKCHALAQLLIASSNLRIFLMQPLKIFDKVQFTVKEDSRNLRQHPENSKTYISSQQPMKKWFELKHFQLKKISSET